MKVEAETLTGKGGKTTHIVRVFGGDPKDRKLIKEIPVPTNHKPIKFCESQVDSDAYYEYHEALRQARKLDMEAGVLHGCRTKISPRQAKEIYAIYIERPTYWPTVQAFRDWLAENDYHFKYSVVRTAGYGRKLGKSGKQVARFTFLNANTKIRKLVEDPAVDIPRILSEVK